MEKALEILRNENVFDEEYLCFNNIDIASAIKELEEAMKPKTCDGCVYGVFGVDSFGLEIECTLAYRCSRGQDDMFKPKDNA